MVSGFGNFFRILAVSGNRVGILALKIIEQAMAKQCFFRELDIREVEDLTRDDKS